MLLTGEKDRTIKPVDTDEDMNTLKDLQMKQPTFGGGPNEELSIDSFVENFRMYVRSKGVLIPLTDAKSVQILKSCLREPAATWFRKLEPQPKTGYSGLDALSGRYAEVENPIGARHLLSSTKQNGEEIIEYCLKFDLMRNRFTDVNEGEALFFFVQGLDDQVRRAIAGRYTTLRQAMERARAAESELGNSKDQPIELNWVQKDQVQKGNHTGRRSHDFRREDSQGSQGGRGFNRGGYRARGRCFRCGKMGHFKANCHVKLYALEEQENKDEDSYYSVEKNREETHWKMNPKYFEMLSEKWGRPEIDCFASSQNCQKPKFIDQNQDCMKRMFSKHTKLWMNPPFRDLERVVDKILTEKLNVILISPKWEGKKWYQKSCAHCAGIVELGRARDLFMPGPDYKRIVGPPPWPIIAFRFVNGGLNRIGGSELLEFNVSAKYKKQERLVSALVDSGAWENFVWKKWIDHSFSFNEKMIFRTRKKIQLANGESTEAIGRITLRIIWPEERQHLVEFMIVKNLAHDLILGMPWLSQYEPAIKWKERSIELNLLITFKSQIFYKIRFQRWVFPNGR